MDTHHLVFTIVHELDTPVCIHISLMHVQRTPLFLACSIGHLAAAEVLIHKGADVTAHVLTLDMITTRSCLDLAVKKGHKYVCHSLYIFPVRMVCMPHVWLDLLCFSDLVRYKILN